MTTTNVDTQAIVAGSGGTSTPVKLTLQSGTFRTSLQMKVTTTRSASPGILTNPGKTFTMYWAFSPDDLTLANVPTLLRHCTKSQKVTLNPDIEQSGQRQQSADKPNGQYMYVWFEYPSSVDAYAVVMTVTETAVQGSPTESIVTANSTGNTTITPASPVSTALVTITGIARTSVFILATTNAQTGWRLDVRLNNPATAAIVEEFRNATSVGTLLASYTTDGTGTDNLLAHFYFNGTAWVLLGVEVPVT